MHTTKITIIALYNFFFHFVLDKSIPLYTLYTSIELFWASSIGTFTNPLDP